MKRSKLGKWLRGESGKTARNGYGSGKSRSKPRGKRGGVRG